MKKYSTMCPSVPSRKKRVRNRYVLGKQVIIVVGKQAILAIRKNFVWPFPNKKRPFPTPINIKSFFFKLSIFPDPKLKPQSFPGTLKNLFSLTIFWSLTNLKLVTCFSWFRFWRSRLREYPLFQPSHYNIYNITITLGGGRGAGLQMKKVFSFKHKI